MDSDKALNLNETADIHYRYKMPKIESVTESSGNGIKTALKNVVKVSQALSRPPIYLTKFLSLELGCIFHTNEKDERYILMGVHKNERLQNLVYVFIKRYVLCAPCGNPETAVQIVKNKKSSTVSLLCSACGAVSVLDPKHRLVGFIVKNPPSDEYKQSTHTQGSNGNKAAAKNGHADRNEATADTSPRQPISTIDLVAELEKLKVEKAAEATIEEKFAKFESVLKPHIATIRSGNETLDLGIIKGFQSYSVDLGIRNTVSSIVARQIFVRESSNSSPIFNDYLTSSWKQILSTFLKANHPSQLNFLAGFEELVCTAKEHPFDLRGVPRLVMFLYTSELIGEEAFQVWYSRLNRDIEESSKSPQQHSSNESTALELKKKLSQSMQQFVEWLDQSTDDDSEEEEEDDGDNVESQNKLEQHPIQHTASAATNGIKNAAPAVVENDKENDDDDEDIDIDGI